MKKFLSPVTPAEQSSALQALVESLVEGGSPVYVPVSPIEGALPDECFLNVDKQVNEHGGSATVGWALWEFPTLFIEAEFHCVWRRPDGTVLDISPKKTPTENILFLPDTTRSYDGHAVNNVRRLISRDPALLGYLATFDEQYTLLTRGERAGQHGMIHLTGSEADEYQDIMRRREQSFLTLFARLPRIGPYHPCPCGSGRKVRWCHSESLSR